MIRYNSNAVGRDSRDPFGVSYLLQSITIEKSQNFTNINSRSLALTDTLTRRSDASEKRRRKYSRPLLAKFACGQVSSPRLYRLRAPEKRSDGIRNRTLWRREIL